MHRQCKMFIYFLCYQINYFVVACPVKSFIGITAIQNVCHTHTHTQLRLGYTLYFDLEKLCEIGSTDNTKLDAK